MQPALLECDDLTGVYTQGCVGILLQFNCQNDWHEQACHCEHWVLIRIYDFHCKTLHSTLRCNVAHCSAWGLMDYRLATSTGNTCEEIDVLLLLPSPCGRTGRIIEGHGSPLWIVASPLEVRLCPLSRMI